MTLNKAYEIASWERTEFPEIEAITKARQALDENPNSGQLWMELGHAYAKQFLVREAADCYSMAVSCDPFNWMYYRYRAHRFLSCWRIEDAAADFTIASRLNPSDWDVLYHLGLAHFLLGNYEKAAQAYKRCHEISEDDPRLIAITDWYWMTLRRLGRDEEAAKLLERIHTEMEAGDNTSYYARLLMYKGLKTPDELLNTDEDPIQLITMGFGVSNFYELSGNRKKSDEVIDRVIKAGDENYLYTAFAYLAAKVDKRNRESVK